LAASATLDELPIDDMAITQRGTIRLLQGRGQAPSATRAATLFGRDEVLEKLWVSRRMRRPRIGSPLVAPSFSTWNDTTPYEHVVQALRTLALAEYLAVDNDVVPSVPLTPWVRPVFWTETLGNPSDIAVEFGTIRSIRWHMYLNLLRELGSAFDPTPRLIAYGIGSGCRMLDVVGTWPGRSLVVSRAPIDMANRGQRLRYPSLDPADAWDRSRRELLVENDAVFRHAVEAATDPSLAVASGGWTVTSNYLGDDSYGRR
jgi:hypothetical protein